MQPPQIHTQAELSEATGAMYVSIQRAQIFVIMSPQGCLMTREQRAGTEREMRNRQAWGSRTRKVAPG